MRLIPLFSIPVLLVFSAACGEIRGDSFDLDPEVPVEGLEDPGFESPTDPCDGIDNNVDGTVDEGCYCTPGDVQPCFSGDPELAGIGACAQLGLQTCIEGHGDFWTGRWGTCVGATLPSPEICGNTIDEDCDGYAPPCVNGDVTGLPCHPGESERCYGGEPGTEGLGQCAAGMRFCGEFDLWGPCEDAVLPAAEICGNGIDESCDGYDASCE